MADENPQAFWSYARKDDEHSRGNLTAIRERLEGELRAQLGTTFNIFQDIKDLPWGAQWQQCLLTSIDDAIFFIPVISPSYFQSKACRTELDTFRQREQAILYEELILPVYWIDVNLPDDDLARTVMTRNYVDFRKLRHTRVGEPTLDENIANLATKLVQRLQEFRVHQGAATNMSATISSPRDHERVPRSPVVTGTASRTPKGVTLWLVVEAGGKFHPQTPIPDGEWRTKATIGTKEFGTRAHETAIHVIATTRTTNERFRKYREEQQRLAAWDGMQLPVAGSRVLDTSWVRRDDLASTLAMLTGSYEEYRARPPQPTGGIITIESTAHGKLAVRATSSAGQLVWTGR